MSEPTHEEVAPTEKVVKRSTVNHFLSCFCCYCPGKLDRSQEGTLVPSLAAGGEGETEMVHAWEARFDEAVSNLARVASERPKKAEPQPEGSK